MYVYSEEVVRQPELWSETQGQNTTKQHVRANAWTKNSVGMATPSIGKQGTL